MKHAYVIRLDYGDIDFYMPYIFTSEKKAHIYGEYKLRKDKTLKHYEIERFEKIDVRFCEMEE